MKPLKAVYHWNGREGLQTYQEYIDASQIECIEVVDDEKESPVHVHFRSGRWVCFSKDDWNHAVQQDEAFRIWMVD